MSNSSNRQISNINTCIPIKSFTSNNIYYITILYNKFNDRLDFNCTCGLHFNGRLRNNCKHIFEQKKLFTEMPISKMDEINNALSNMGINNK